MPASTYDAANKAALRALFGSGVTVQDGTICSVGRLTYRHVTGALNSDDNGVWLVDNQSRRWKNLAADGNRVHLDWWDPAIDDGVTASNTAVQQCRDYLSTNGGGTMVLPAKNRIRITNDLIWGNGATGGVWSSQPGFLIEGQSGGATIGAYNPVDGCGLILDGCSLRTSGPISGTWGIRNCFVNARNLAANAAAIDIIEGQGGVIERVGMVVHSSLAGARGIRMTGYGFNNSAYNRVADVEIYLGDTAGASAQGAVAIELNHPSGDTDAAENTLDGIHVQPTRADQIGLILGHSDTNMISRFVMNPISLLTPGQKAVCLRLDYTNNNNFPTSNSLWHLDPFWNTVDVVGTPSALSLVEANRVFHFSNANGALHYDLPGLTIERRKLSRDENLYVDATTGSDTLCNGLSSLSPFKTIQRAWEVICRHYDLNGRTVTIKCANSTSYAPFSATLAPVGGDILIEGNLASPSLCQIVSSGRCVQASGNGVRVTIKGFLLQSANSGAIIAFDGAQIDYANIAFSTCNNMHVYAMRNGITRQVGAVDVVGNASFHLLAETGGLAENQAPVNFVPASTAFSVFAVAATNGVILSGGATFTGNVAGVVGGRYAANYGGNIATMAGGPTFYPGNAAGSTTGGYYT